eukprot:CAMPEP_0198563686 /NCGR_PEP_ID=MMETSP1462-20131121/99134_1 /TAXON_ID=1333877 /ORGANISM="Brandtodinium nutriculum, Strain RCC3387" /LENGTH=74 /DNA_ID=CAMNT_0044294637 /DNA_START=12 /DNA_END=232 /DNA_ORIENTATION=-
MKFRSTKGSVSRAPQLRITDLRAPADTRAVNSTSQKSQVITFEPSGHQFDMTMPTFLSSANKTDACRQGHLLGA